MSTQFDYDVFLSYNHKDKPVVRELANRLKQDGLCVWLDEWEIQPGDMIGLKISQGLERSRIPRRGGTYGHATSLFRLGMVDARASDSAVPRSGQCPAPVHSVAY
jgi:hypothetical protein